MRCLSSLLAVLFIFVGTTSVSQQFDLKERFEPAHTLDFIEKIIDRASCTPICGTPTCCIAFQQNVVTHVSDQPFEEFSQVVQSFGFSVPEMMSAAVADNSIYDQMNLTSVANKDDTESKAQELMDGAQALGADLSCTPCCYPCGGRTCCGGCWTF